MIHLVALGIALGDADHKVSEEGGNNRGPRIRQYLDNVDPPIAHPAPWCAAFVQYCGDAAARALGVTNPLDAVKLEAYVQSYHDHFAPDAEIPAEIAQAGDLVLFSFGQQRWDHIGFVAQPPNADGVVWCVEGNTSPTDDRDGDGVSLKPRTLARQATTFLRWAN